MPKFILSHRWLGLFLVILVAILFAHSWLPALGWDPASTPQAYLPVMLKFFTPTPTDTQTPQPTATLTPTPEATTPPPTDWLGYVNWLRSLGGLSAVTENSPWSIGCQHHAKYMVKNDYIGHSEDPSNPWYTADGASAAGSSDVMVSSNPNATDFNAIDLWMSGPFHGIGIIDPALSVSGFGSYRYADGGWQMGACLDVIRGLGSIPPSVTFPIMWPSDGGTLPYTRYSGSEAPDPLTSCPGYSTSSGPPVYLQIGSGNQTPNVTYYSFRQGSTTLQACEIDETNYTNPDSGSQSLGRSVLNMRDAIVLMPKATLTPGDTYTVSITNSGTTYTWSFTVPISNMLVQSIFEIR